MKRILIGAVAVLALSSATAATAADLAVPPAPVYSSWTGVYSGWEVGAKWTSDKWTATCFSANGSGANCGTAANPFFVDASSPQTLTTSGLRTGSYAGVNWQFSPQFVFGVEIDVAWYNQTATVNGLIGCTTFCGFLLPTAANIDSTSVHHRGDGSGRLRFGFLPRPDVMLYATGGGAVEAVQETETCSAAGPWCVTPRTQTNSQWLGGWTIGGGIEWKYGNNWIFRGEYRYAQFQTIDTNFFAGSVDYNRASIKDSTQIATLGLSYLFNWGGPVVAKY
jgi:outer membrane immunogenic protein